MIADGDPVVLRFSDGRCCTRRAGAGDSVKIGRKKVQLGALVGARLGATFELQQGRLVAVSGGLHVESLDALGEADGGGGGGGGREGDNDTVVDAANANQALTQAEVEEMKTEAACGADIVRALVGGNASFQQRSSFAKAKYVRRKLAKHAPRLRVLPANALTMCEVYETHAQGKICNLSPDMLLQILSAADVRAGSRVLLVESTLGLLAGAMVERMGGRGRVLAGFAGQQLDQAVLGDFGFAPEVRATVVPFNLNELTQYERPDAECFDPLAGAGGPRTAEELAAQAAEIKERLAKLAPEELARQRAKRERRMQRVFKVGAPEQRAMLREGVDSLVVATDMEPWPVVERALPVLAPSSPIVVFSPFLPLLSEVFWRLKARGGVVNMRISTTFVRDWQVVDGASHPAMIMPPARGYLLTGTAGEIFEQPAEKRPRRPRRGKSSAGEEEEDGVAGAGDGPPAKRTRA